MSSGGARSSFISLRAALCRISALNKSANDGLKETIDMLDEFDFNEFYELLLDATRKAFRAILDAHPDETFYTFALYYSDDALVVIPSCNSEEGHLRYEELTPVDRDEQTLDWFYSRWSFWDWAYCSSRDDDNFGPVTARLNAYLKPFIDAVTDEGMMDYMIGLGTIEKACARVMQALDREGLFGVGQAREKVVLNVLNKETLFVEDDLSYAYLLNHTSTYERWRIEFEMYKHALLVSDIAWGLF
jgi:hypothetical protein